MAYGMPMPQVPFPYFYPSKINNQSDPKTYHKHLAVPPVNFTTTLKRESEVRDTKYYETDSVRDDDKNSLDEGRLSYDKVESTDCEMLEDNENVEID